MNYLFGIDIGGTTVKMGLLSEDGKIIDKFEIKTNKENNGELILKDIASSLLTYIDEKNISQNSIKGIGFGVPGPVANNIVTVCVNLGWKNKDLEKEFLSLIPFKTKIACGNDANVAAIGEMWQGVEADVNSAIMITLGTGVGGGVIVDGKAIDGFNGAGGEIGHIKVDFKHEFNCNCGLKGCLETVTSATGVVNLAKKYLLSEDSSLKDIKELTCKDVFDNYSNDKVANKVVDEVCMILGYTCSVLAATTNPEVFIIGGGVSKAGKILIDGIKKNFQEFAFAPVKNTSIVLAKLGNDAGMIGAAFIAKN